MKGILFALAFLVCAASVQAQTHPCDISQAPSFTVKSGIVTLTACHDSKDADGDPVTITGWTAVVDASRIAVTMTKGAVSNAAGFYQYTGTFPVKRGMHILTVETVFDDSGAPAVATSAPFQVTAKMNPKPATNIVVK